MNQINPTKLPNSKWTATTPLNREKHFVVSKVTYADNGAVTLCKLEAVLSRCERTIDWHELKNSDHWTQGWK